MTDLINRTNSLELKLNKDTLANQQKDAGFHFEPEKIKLAATQIKGKLSNQKFKGVVDETYYKGVGVAIKEDWNLDTKLKQAGLDWQTEVSPLKYGKRMQYINNREQAVYRGDTGELFGVTPDSWQPYQNREVVSAFDEFCESAGIEMERLGSLREGRLVFASAIVNESWQVLGSDDVIAARLLLTNSHEYGIGLTAKLNAVRLVCCNGVTRKLSIGTKSIGHNTAFSKASVMAILESSKQNFANLGELFDQLAQVRLNNRDAKDFLIETLGDREEESNKLKTFTDQNKLVRHSYYNFANHTSVGAGLEGSHSTAWELLNCVTEQINHHSRSYGEAHIRSLWHGGKAMTENKVLSAMEHAFLNREQAKQKALTARVSAF